MKSRQEIDHDYNTSAKGRERYRRYDASPKGRERDYRRYKVRLQTRIADKKERLQFLEAQLLAHGVELPADFWTPRTPDDFWKLSEPRLTVKKKVLIQRA